MRRLCCVILDTSIDCLKSRLLSPFSHATNISRRCKFMDRGGFDEALESLDSLIAEYAELEKSGKPTSTRSEACGGDARLRPVF